MRITLATLDNLINALRDARPYVDGAYECAFPNEHENSSVLADIDSALATALALRLSDPEGRSQAITRIRYAQSGCGDRLRDLTSEIVRRLEANQFAEARTLAESAWGLRDAPELRTALVEELGAKISR